MVAIFKLLKLARFTDSNLYPIGSEGNLGIIILVNCLPHNRRKSIEEFQDNSIRALFSGSGPL